MWHIWVSSFGVTTAILVIGGYVLLQWQRNRHRYQLMQAAVERGITEFPNTPPYWLVSMRQGVAILALGVGLLIVGGAAYALTQGVQPPEPPSTQSIVAGSQVEAAGSQAPGHERPKPPAPNPAMERWHRAQHQESIGLATMGCGLIVLLLGVVRTAFARTERKYALK